VNFRWDACSLTIEWPDGTSRRYPAVWLRDQSPDDRDPGTGQRLVDITDLLECPEIQSVRERDGVLTIVWAGESATTILTIDWLRSLLEPRRREAVPWTGREVGRLQWTHYAVLGQEERSKRDWLAALLRDGIAFQACVPTVEGEVANAARLLGSITETNYGRIFDVRAVAAPNNLAYTPRGLGVHTDNPYRDPVPGYQLLHCIERAEGGQSVFVDGFAVAAALREDDSDAFATLVRIPVQFAFRDAEADLSAERCLIELDHSGEVHAIHYKNRSISTARVLLGEAEEFYRAYRKFARMLRAPKFEYRVTLKPGDLVAVDNSRVLHGRTPFTGSRLLQGCYVCRDGVASNLAVLRRRIPS
jgi:alpha-ketoglutarate-dependent taurine dioxygenase